MRRQFVLVFCMFVSVGLAIAEESDVRWSPQLFRAEVQSIEVCVPRKRHTIYTYDPEQIRGSHEGVIVVGADAGWGVKLKIVEIHGEGSLFHTGDVYTFVIHSPTMTFGSADAVIGKKVWICLFGEAEKGRVSISHFAVVEEEEKAANQALQTTPMTRSEI